MDFDLLLSPSHQTQDADSFTENVALDSVKKRSSESRTAVRGGDSQSLAVDTKHNVESITRLLTSNNPIGIAEAFGIIQDWYIKGSANDQDMAVTLFRKMLVLKIDNKCVPLVTKGIQQILTYVR